MIRQGDILFIPQPQKPEARHHTPVKDGIIAEGEATGHHHRIATEDLDKAVLTKPWRGIVDGSVLEVTDSGGIRIVHEEHHTVTLPQGTYLIHQAREYDYFSGLTAPVRD